RFANPHVATNGPATVQWRAHGMDASPGVATNLLTCPLSPERMRAYARTWCNRNSASREYWIDSAAGAAGYAVDVSLPYLVSRRRVERAGRRCRGRRVQRQRRFPFEPGRALFLQRRPSRTECCRLR